MTRTLNTILAVSAMTLTACTRPAPVEAPPEQVQQTLAPPAGQVLPSATLPPSATAPITPSPTLPATDTPGPDVTATVPVLPTDDARYGLNLAAPDYRDNFNSNLTWVGPNFEGASNLIRDNQLVATDYLADGFLWWSTTIPDIDAGNIYVEVTAEFDECAGKDAAGLALRVEPNQRNSGYTLEVSCDGSYRVRKLLSGSIRTLLDWQEAEAINRGENATNVLSFQAQGNQLSVFVNGTQLAQVEDTAFIRGNYGLYADAAQTAGFTVRFTEFKLWYL
ncbi:MAG: hypothetical protein PVI81_06905 [Anaerolineales bacterium]